MRWSAVLFIWAIVAGIFAYFETSSIASRAGWLFCILFLLMFLAFFIVGMANARPVLARSHP